MIRCWELGTPAQVCSEGLDVVSARCTIEVVAVFCYVLSCMVVSKGNPTAAVVAVTSLCSNAGRCLATLRE
jgi:hypothetical protein